MISTWAEVQANPRKTQDIVNNLDQQFQDLAGSLCGLRFTYERPKKNSLKFLSLGQVSLYEVVCGGKEFRVLLS